MGATLGVQVESASSEAHGLHGGSDPQEGISPPGLVSRRVNGCLAADTTNDHKRLSFWLILVGDSS